MGFTADLQKVDSHLTGLITDVEAALNGLPAPNQQSWRNDADRRRGELKEYSKTISTYQSRIRDTDFQTLTAGLLSKQDEIANRTRVQIENLVYGLIGVVVLGLGIKLKQRFGQEKGLREVEQFKGDYDALLEFIKTNKYSFRVNEVAVYYLSGAIRYDTAALKKANDVAEFRFGKPGYINERVGSLLRELVKGIENVLNRKDR